MILGNLKNQAVSFLDQYKNQSPAAYAAAQQAIGGLLIFDGFFGIPHPFGGGKRPGIFGAAFGIVAGVVFLFIPTIFNTMSGINKMTATTNATIVSVSQPQSTTTDSNGSQHTSTSCTAVATYTVDGKQYTQSSSFGSSGMCSLSQGELTQINYNPNSPGQWGTGVKAISSVVKLFFYAGIFVIISSFVLTVIRLLSIIFGWKLLKSGRKLAKTLPPGTDTSTSIREIENAFKTALFGFNASSNDQPNQMQNPMQQSAPMYGQPSAPSPVNAPTQTAATPAVLGQPEQATGQQAQNPPQNGGQQQ